MEEAELRQTQATTTCSCLSLAALLAAPCCLAASGYFWVVPVCLAGPGWSWLVLAAQSWQLWAAPACCWQMLVAPGLLLPAAGCSWLFLAAPEVLLPAPICSWLLLVAALGCFELLLAAADFSQLHLATPGCSWLLPASNPKPPNAQETRAADDVCCEC